jgi:hypothetical protein
MTADDIRDLRDQLAGFGEHRMDRRCHPLDRRKVHAQSGGPAAGDGEGPAAAPCNDSGVPCKWIVVHSSVHSSDSDQDGIVLLPERDELLARTTSATAR